MFTPVGLDTRPIASDWTRDWTPDESADESEDFQPAQFALRLERCAQVTCSYDAFCASENVEARQARHAADTERALAEIIQMRARLAAARAAELAREMTWDEMVKEYLE